MLLCLNNLKLNLKKKKSTIINAISEVWRHKIIMYSFKKKIFIVIFNKDYF